MIASIESILSHSEELLRKSSVHLRRKLTASSLRTMNRRNSTTTTTISYSSRIFDYNCKRRALTKSQQL